MDWSKVNEEAIGKLADYIRIDTSNPPGNEIAAAKWFGQIFQAEGIPCEIAESAPGRGNIVARLKGTGAEPALILLSHMDVVPVRRECWTADPFAAVVRDGYLWGRGTLDMKGLAIAQLMSFLLLHRNGVPLRRDVIFLATADEEAGGACGSGWIVNHRADWIGGAGYLLTETSSASAEENGRPRRYRIIVGEKAPAWLKLTAKGHGGHAAYPNSQSAANKLIAALERLRTERQPLQVTPGVRSALRTQAAWEPEPWRSRFQEIENYVQTPGAYDELVERPALLALLTNTVSITQFQGSEKINMVPASAVANVDCRLLPGTSVEHWIEHIRRILQDDSISIEKLLYFKPNESPAETALTRTIADCVRRLHPDAALVNDVQPSFTDAHYFRGCGIVSYGFPVFAVSAADRVRPHGDDERIPIDAFTDGVRLLWEVVHAFSATD